MPYLLTKLSLIVIVYRMKNEQTGAVVVTSQFLRHSSARITVNTVEF